MPNLNLPNFNTPNLAAVALGSALAALSACRVAEHDPSVIAAKSSWQATLRANHVLPVAPCNEDLIPGDVFLIHESLAAQRARFQTESCIVLGPHLARLQSTDYLDFYTDAFVDPQVDVLRLPVDWSQNDAAFTGAPGASFPSLGWTFAADAAGSLELPITAVSTGMDILRTQQAEASVVLHARTYGVDVLSLDAHVRAWAEDHRDWLASWAPNAVRTVRMAASTDMETTPRYTLQHSTLRVVARVFVANRATVALQSTAAVAESNGPAREIQQPGGAIRIRSIAPRSITIEERLDPPLTLGCLCIDLQIRADGSLGPAVSTWALLTDDDLPQSLLNRARVAPMANPPVQRIASRLVGRNEQVEPHGQTL